jgi:O-antigen ligase
MFRSVQAHRRIISPGIERFSLTTLTIVAIATVYVIVVPSPFNGAGLIAVIAGLALITYPILLPLGLIASVPVQDALPVPDDLPITATRIMTVAAITLLPLALLRHRIPVRWSWLLLFVLLLITALSISTANARDPIAPFGVMYHWLVAGFVFWLILQFVVSSRQIRVMLAGFAVLAFVQGAIGAGQAVFGLGPDSFQIASGFSRAYGAFGMPNSYAAYLEAVAIPLIPVSIWSLGRAKRQLATYQRERVRGHLASAPARQALIRAVAFSALLLCGTTVGLLGLALSFSRGGWLGSIAAITIIVALLGRRAIIGSMLAAIALSFVLIVGLPGESIDVVGDRFSQLAQQVQIGDIRGVPVTDDNFAAVERMAHWQTALAMWEQHPVVGIGAGNFDDRFTEFAVHPQFIQSQGHAHNFYLHMLAESGIIGLTAYLLFLGATFWIGWRAYRSQDAFASYLGIGAIGLSTALMVHNVFENLHVLNITVQMMAVWALALVAMRISPTTSEKEASRDRRKPLLYDSGGQSVRLSSRRQQPESGAAR